MKNSPRKPLRNTTNLTSLLLCSVLLVACGGSSVLLSGIGGTGIVFGAITGFGSVFVNGSKFDIDSSQITVDGNSNATQADLALGMVVRLEVEIENGIFADSAIRIVYDDEIEGPVAATPLEVPGSAGSRRQFEILGQNITIDETGTLFENTSFDAIDADDVLEISGFLVSPGAISATYVRKTGILILGATEVELRGTISNYSPGPPQAFNIDGISISTDAMTTIEVPNGVLMNGLYVEVEGIIQTPTSVLAAEIEFEDEDFGEEVDEVSLQGIISNYVSDANFQVGGQSVDASAAQISPSGIILMNGLEVEVEGEITGGILLAEEVELREGDARLHSVVSAVDLPGNRFELNYPPLPGSVLVNVDSRTRFEDESPLQLPNFSLNQLNIGDFVQVEGIEVNGVISASAVKRGDSANPDDSKLQGEVDAFVAGSSITILGVAYGMGAGTIYDNGSLDSTQFFGQLMPGDVIKIKDAVVADGIADEVESD